MDAEMVVDEVMESLLPPRMHERRSIELRFDEFGWRALEITAGGEGALAEFIADACGYFAAELESGRAATRLPRFRGAAPGGEGRELELDARAHVWERLEAEAERQDVELPRIVEHAALLYLADLDSGRAIRRLLEGD